MTELKPCPFCKSNTIQTISQVIYRMGENKQRLYGNEQWYVVCPYCSARTGFYISEHDAEEAWNRRDGEQE